MKWSRSKIDVNGIKINFYRSGELRASKAEPPVILAHGITDSGLCWDRMAELLSGSYDVVAVDARGHGHSDRPETGYGPGEHAEDLAGLIEALKFQRPILIGHSMGADSTAMLAHLWPEMPRCLVLEDPPWNAAADQPTPEEAEKRAEEWREEIRNHQHRSHAEVMAFGRENRPGWHESEYEPWADAKHHVDLRVLDYLTRRIPWSEIVPSIQCPTLLVTADPAKGSIVTPETAEEISRMNSNFEIVRIEGAGHNIRREQFEGYSEAVMEFLHNTR